MTKVNKIVSVVYCSFMLYVCFVNYYTYIIVEILNCLDVLVPQYVLYHAFVSVCCGCLFLLTCNFFSSLS